MNAGIINWKTILVGTIAVLAILSGLQMLRAPDRILEDVLVSDEKDHLQLQIKFGMPVRYEDHFPAGNGSLVQVKVRPVSLTDTAKNEYLGSESILPGFMALVPVTDIAYEGNVPGGPFLTVRFREPVSFKISEGPSYSSIIFSVAKRG